MRRTSFLVLVLAVLLVVTAAASPPSPARKHHAAPPAKAASRASHTRRPAPLHKTPTHARHSYAERGYPRHVSSHPSSRLAGHAVLRRASIVRRQPAVKEAPDTNAQPQSPPEDGSTEPGAPQSAKAAAIESDSLDQPEPAPEIARSEPIAEPASEPARDPDRNAAPVAEVASLTPIPAIMPPPMRGSLASLERQNQRSEAEGLERIANERVLSDRIAHKLLVPVPVSDALTINQDLPLHHRYCRPWTARFLADLARAHAAVFHGPLEVSSAVRTVDYQKRLIAVNGNAAAAEGEIVSPHLTGATIDIAKSAMSQREIGWMRSFLTPLQDAGKIDVEEEFQQACFHITVYGNYAPPVPARSKTTPTAVAAHGTSKRSNAGVSPKSKPVQPESAPETAAPAASESNTPASDSTALLGAGSGTRV